MNELTAEAKHRYALRVLFTALALAAAPLVGIAVVTGASVVEALFVAIAALGLNIAPWGGAWWVCRRRKVALDVPEIRRLSIHYTASVAVGFVAVATLSTLVEPDRFSFGLVDAVLFVLYCLTAGMAFVRMGFYAASGFYGNTTPATKERPKTPGSIYVFLAAVVMVDVLARRDVIPQWVAMWFFLTAMSSLFLWYGRHHATSQLTRFKPALAAPFLFAAAAYLGYRQRLVPGWFAATTLVTLCCIGGFGLVDDQNPLRVLFFLNLLAFFHFFGSLSPFNNPVVAEIKKESRWYVALSSAVIVPLLFFFLPTTCQLTKEVMEAAQGKINTLVGFGFGRTPLELWGLLGAMAAWLVLTAVGCLVVADGPQVEDPPPPASGA